MNGDECQSRLPDIKFPPVSLPLVSRLLGHATLETTRSYAKPSLKMLREAIESVETPGERAVRPVWEADEAMMAKLCGLR